MNLKKEVEQDMHFYLADGKVIKSLPEMLEALKGMEEWVYESHVNHEKNDFVNWIEAIASK